MRASMAYFAGAGTVIAAIVVGLGGGLLISDIMSPQGTKTPSRLEQHAAAQPSPSSTGANAQQTAPYLAATQAAATPTVVAPAPSASPQPNPEPRSASNNGQPPAAKTDATASTDTAKTPQDSTTRDQAPAPDNAYAKARDADLKQVEAKKKAERAERRQIWAARRQQQRELEQRAVDRRGDFIVRRDDRDDESERPDLGRPPRPEFPRMLFGED